LIKDATLYNTLFQDSKMPELAPSLSSIPMNVHRGMEQRVQCKLPDGIVWDISWDGAQNRVTLFVMGEAFIVNCSDTPIIPEYITLSQVIKAIGYDVREYNIETTWCEEENSDIRNLIDAPVKALPLLQIDIVTP
jgi:hypothetical protein